MRSLLLVALFSAPAFADVAVSDHAEVGTPLLVVFVESGAVPRLALFDDGTVIYGKYPEMWRAQLAPAQRAALERRLELVELASLDANHAVTDSAYYLPPCNLVHFWSQGEHRRISVSGRLTERGRRPLPEALEHLFARVVAYKAPGAKAWRPSSALMRVLPFHNAAETVSWPDELPRPDEKGEVRLNGADIERAQSLSARMTARTAVVVSGQKYQLGGMHLAFPREETFR